MRSIRGRDISSLIVAVFFLVFAAAPAHAGFCLNGPGSHNKDTDLDGVVDCDDNCPLLYNEDQADADLDGVGDDCDCGLDVVAGDATSLRAAVESAPAGCAIAVPAGTYLLGGVALSLQQSVSLLGTGAAGTVIDQGGAAQPVVHTIRQNGAIFIGGLTLTGGSYGAYAAGAALPTYLTLSDVVVGANGLGIVVRGGLTDDDTEGATVFLNNSIVMNNATGGVEAQLGPEGWGRLFAAYTRIEDNTGSGAIVTGEAWFAHCRIAGNDSSGDGGGLRIGEAAIVSFTDGTISGNTTQGSGGGVFSAGNRLLFPALVDLARVTISGNVAQGSGGGVFNGGAVEFAADPPPPHYGSEMSLSNVTISGNTAGSLGGGLFNDGGYAFPYRGGKIACQNCTITGNDAAGGGGVAFDLNQNGESRLANTVIAGNTADSGFDCSGPMDSLGYNLIQQLTGCLIGGDTTGNILNVNAQLGPLADNGGPTLTHLPGPPLRGTANPGAPWDQGLPRCPLTDQRGEMRPGGLVCDIGAVEIVCAPPGTDPDQDAICDGIDNCPLVPNADQGDTDQDGVGNGCDNCPTVVNPAQTDSDGDGKGDECDGCPFSAVDDPDTDGFCADRDNCPTTFNPNQLDVDSDGLGDVCDNCPNVSNPGQQNSDTDAQGDACDACPLANPNDADGDGVCGNVDNCPTLSNSNQLDSDADGLGNVCDNCPTVANPSQQNSDGDGQGDACDPCPSSNPNDADADGICGNVDNCPTNANANQLDSDADGRGDVCDNCPTVSNPTQQNSDSDAQGDACDACPFSNPNDADSDGVCGNVDNCPTVPNPGNLDGDADGRGDVCDNCPTVANSSQQNSDGDAQGNACDPCPFSNPNDSDADGVCGNVDNCPNVANSTQLDSDADGRGNACDNCPLVANSTQTDGDLDGVGNACDNCPTIGNASQLNSDTDPRGNACDNCPNHTNPGQEDFDHDGLGDVCDVCPFGNVDLDLDGVCEPSDNCPADANPGQLDADADDVGDACDNCPLDANDTQLDSDGDGLGNACDGCPLSGLQEDVDGDGLCNEVDNCPLVVNEDQLDGDGDSVGDMCDNCQALANRAQQDFDDRGQWAVSASATSEWSPAEWSAAQATGAPESLGICEDVPTSWAPATGDSSLEWIDLSYAVPVHASSVVVHETWESGFVRALELFEPGGALHTLGSVADPTTCGQRFVHSFEATPYLVSGVRVVTQIEGYEEIDAVELVSAFGDGIGDACDTCPGTLGADQTDTDGDGRGDLCDCAPMNPFVRTPDPVALTATKTAPDVIRLEWSWPLGADVFNIVRGRTDQLASSDYGACFAPALAAQSIEDAELSPLNTALMYLVQPVSSACGADSLGHRSDGTKRVNANPYDCP